MSSDAKKTLQDAFRYTPPSKDDQNKLRILNSRRAASQYSYRSTEPPEGYVNERRQKAIEEAKAKKQAAIDAVKAKRKG